MEALDYKEDAQRLQALGLYDEALPLMLRSVRLRENSHTLCLSLSELAELYLDMLKPEEAEDAAGFRDGSTDAGGAAATARGTTGTPRGV